VDVTEKELRDHIEKLAIKITWLDFHVTTLETYSQSSFNSELEILNKFPALFPTLAECLMQRIVIDIFNVLDSGKDANRGLRKFINKLDLFIGKNPNILTDGVNVKNHIKWNNSEFSEMEDFLYRLKSQRDKYWAHMDKLFFDDPHKLGTEYPIPISEIRHVANFLKRSVGVFYFHLTSQKISLEFSNKNELYRLIKLLEEMQSREENVEYPE
jgi:AbiU2